MKQSVDFTPDSERKILEQYRRYRDEMSEINRKLIEMQDDKSEPAIAQRSDLFARRDALRTDIFKLIPFNHAEFEKYAERMLGHVRNAILGSDFMSDCIINWGAMDAQKLKEFGTILADALDRQYRESDIKIDFTLHPTNADEYKCAAGYDWDKTIYLYADEDYVKNPDDFIGTLLHEFIHYLCVKHPGKSPLGKQFAFIAARHYLQFFGGPKNQKEFDEYKNQPFERPAYQIQDYITAREFAKNLRADIIVHRAMRSKLKGE